MASAGWTRKRSSSRLDARGELVVFFRGLLGDELSGERLQLAQEREKDQIEPMRKREFTIAMPTGPSAVSMNGNGEKVLTP